MKAKQGRHTHMLKQESARLVELGQTIAAAMRRPAVVEEPLDN
jgi:hypothetical protein